MIPAEANEDLRDDIVSFIPEAPPPVGAAQRTPWKVMIADDDQGVHDATRLSLSDVVFRGRGIQFIDAYSAAEACALLNEHHDVALVFLDVVMESEEAGLKAVRQIREEGHALVRIVLRTGHPGYAPEREVVVNYDIHDYKEKTTLDYQKLFSCLISALRAYDDLQRIEQHRLGLLSVLEAVSWFDFRSLQRYLSRMLSELSTLASIEVDDLFLAARQPSGNLCAVLPEVGNDAYIAIADCTAGPPASAVERRFIAEAFDQRKALKGSEGAAFFATAHGIDLVIFTRDPHAMAEADSVLLELFLTKVAQALDNHATFAVVLKERDSLVRSFVTLGEQWGGHDNRELERIQDLSRQISMRLQRQLSFPNEIDDWFVYSIATASGFHDLGLRELPHRLFEQRGALTAEERTEIEAHVLAGVALLRERLSGLLDTRLYAMAESVIRQHHERYDGSGYPAGLSGEGITLPAIIVGVADTFVAMTSQRPYREAHSRADAIAFIAAGSGRLFDPRVVDAFLESVDSSV